jgi:hypothetical protein
MRETRTTSTAGSGKACAEVVTGRSIRDLYGAFLENWRVRDFAEAHYYLGRCRQAIEEHCGRDEPLVAQVRRVDALLTTRQTAGPVMDGELAEALVILRNSMNKHLE